MTAQLPKLVATSVVRGSEKGQSHGGVYLIDFAEQRVEQKIDWNTGAIDFAGRGWDRGLRGIEFTDDAIWIAASDELFCYSPDFELIDSYRNDYLRHCHEICRRDNLLFLTSTGIRYTKWVEHRYNLFLPNHNMQLVVKSRICHIFCGYSFKILLN